MILADRKSVGDDTLERLTAAPVRAIMQRLAVLLKPTDAHVGSGTQPIPMLDFDDSADDSDAPVVAAPLVRAAPAAVLVTPVAVSAATPVISAEEIDDILEFELAPESQPAAARAPRPTPSPPIARNSATRWLLKVPRRPWQTRWTCSILISRNRRRLPGPPRAPPPPPLVAASAAPPRRIPTVAPVARATVPAAPPAATRAPAPAGAATPAPAVAAARVAAAPKIVPAPRPAAAPGARTGARSSPCRAQPGGAGGQRGGGE